MGRAYIWDLDGTLLDSYAAIVDGVYDAYKGFDVILKKEATMYIDSKYDVTKDVIEGLNKNYVKVKKED